MKQLQIIPIETDGIHTLVEISYINFTKNIENDITNPAPVRKVINSIPYFINQIKIQNGQSTVGNGNSIEE